MFVRINMKIVTKLVTNLVIKYYSKDHSTIIIFHMP